MSLHPRTPVLIGQGQAIDRDTQPATPKHPVALMTDAVTSAFRDASIATPSEVDAVRVVRLLSWKYSNAAHALASGCGISAREYATTPHGGNMPQTLVNLSARQIADGELDLVVLAGGECARTRSVVKDAGALPWPDPNAALGSAPAAAHIVEDLALLNDEEQRLGIVLPVQYYPMFETAIRAAAGRSIEEHDKRIAELWSRFSAVAAQNPFAWSRSAMSASEVLAVSPSNRMIGLPYRKVMNSNNQVNLAAALVMCSVEKAEALGVPRDRWVFPWSGTDCHEHQFVSNRWSFAETPAVRLGGERALRLAGLDVDDVSLVDLYSCFPSAVQLGAQSLGLDLARQLTLTGGLSFAGGPWNNYVMHSIATAMMRLREQPGEHALIWANGGYATKHAFGTYAATPPPSGFKYDSPQAEVDALPKRELAVGDDAHGAAVVEAYTVMHDRNGAPERLIAAALLDDGRRAWINVADAALAAEFTSGEQVARRVVLRRSGELQSA
ncbi:MAG: acetyl-CoA acetyltransferase [Ilumatobacteraceae bacterium]